MIWQLRDRTHKPPKPGFVWIDPETMETVEGSNYANWISAANEHRIGNSLPLPDESQMQNQLCGRMDEKTRRYYCDPVDENGLAQVLGVGGTLKSMLAAIGLNACWGCLNLAKRMDEWGPSKCEQNMPEILEAMLSNAEQRNWARFVPWKEQGAEWFVRAAIKQVRDAQVDIVTETT